MGFADQSGYRCRMDWGRRGVREAAARGALLVVVDVLRFSTTVATAVQHGAEVYPYLLGDDLAGLEGAHPGASREYGLSPCDCDGVPPGTRIALTSLNGATCSRYGSRAPYLFVAALVNRSAVAEVVNEILDRTALAVTVVACGEQWTTPDEGERLRFAVEDYLGAGAVLAALRHSKSPEARVCESAFLGEQGRLTEILHECASGREMAGRGRGADVEHAARLDVYEAVPVMREGKLTRF